MSTTTPLDKTKALLKELIAFPTVSTDSNLELIESVRQKLETLGARVSVFQNEPGTKANLFATLGPDVDGGIVLSGHTDVVPVVEQDWTHDPFVMTERDGKLYGRGSCDMKGFIAACLAMAPGFADTALKRPIHFAFTHDEETGCIGARSLVADIVRLGVKPHIVIIGEPTDMRVIEGHKGCYEYSTQFVGLEGHGSAPAQGVNAAEYATRYVMRLMSLRQTLRDRAPTDSRFEPPETTINIGGIHGGVAPNVIVGKAHVDWEMRPVQEGDADLVKNDLQNYVDDTLLPQMQAVHPAASIHTHCHGEVPGLEPMEHNAARDLMTTLTGANGAELVAFGTEAGLFQSIGMNAVVCGPGSITQAHKPDEYLALDQLEQCLAMLCKLKDRLTDPTHS